MKYILKWTLFSLAFVPLIVNFDTLFPFIFTKTLLIRSAITLFFAIFAVWFFKERQTVYGLVEENWRFVKNPLYMLTAAYIMLMLVSTVFAVDSYRAFFGDIERGEGLLGTFHFFGFFVASLLVFNKKDWVTFFKFNLISGVILLVDSIGELVSGEVVRAQSFVGNPTFLAGYFLFVTFSAIVVFYSLSFSRGEMFWKISSLAMIPGGVAGLFMTGTRGAILGLAAGVAFATLFFAVKGRGIKVKFLRADLQKVSMVLLVIGVLFVGSFVATRDAPFWQSIPGVNRFTTISISDPTLQTRLISAGVSLRSIDPSENRLRRFIIGYGPENFNIAYNPRVRTLHRLYKRNALKVRYKRIRDEGI